MIKVEDLSNGQETVPIPLVVDDDRDTALKLPVFQYATSCVSGPGVNFNPQEALYPGCNCHWQRCSSDCPCVRRYGNTYNHDGHLILTHNEDSGYCQPVIECNSRCSCSTACPNRVSQRGAGAKVEVFPCGSKGWGVRAKEKIIRNTFMFEYAGELISRQEAQRRITECKDFANYIFVLREHIAHNQILCTHVDAYHYGNVSRFVNHSCEPNLFIFPVRVNSPVPKLALFALRDIEVGEELSFDYSGVISGPQHPTFVNCLQHESKKQFSNTFKEGFVKCSCGSLTCKKYLPYDCSLYEDL